MMIVVEVGPVLLSLLQTALGAYLAAECVRAIMIIVISRTKDVDEFEEEGPELVV